MESASALNNLLPSRANKPVLAIQILVTVRKCCWRLDRPLPQQRKPYCDKTKQTYSSRQLKNTYVNDLKVSVVLGNLHAEEVFDLRGEDVYRSACREPVDQRVREQRTHDTHAKHEHRQLP